MSELKRRPAVAPTTLALLAFALVLAGCGGPGPADPPAADPAPAAPAPTASRPAPAAGPVRLGDAPAYVALAAKDLNVRSRPFNGRVVALFPANLPWGGPTPFLVEGARRTEAGDVWLKVLLPRRPNGSTGWVRRDEVNLKPVSEAVEVDLSARRASLLRNGRPVRTFRVAVGTSSTPTPTGRFFVTVKLRPPQISTVYGAWALGLSGYSNVLDQFGTGDGQIALHGTYNPSVLGSAVSNGCVRMDNDTISHLADRLPLGTPVIIRP
jgi:lipoprotein-anchoring transpeptidase ErfK/SrfK